VASTQIKILDAGSCGGKKAVFGFFPSTLGVNELVVIRTPIMSAPNARKRACLIIPRNIALSSPSTCQRPLSARACLLSSGTSMNVEFGAGVAYDVGVRDRPPVRSL
jgi:hypothetical protein